MRHEIDVLSLTDDKCPRIGLQHRSGQYRLRESVRRGLVPRMRTEQHRVGRFSEHAMSKTTDEKERTNGYLPTGVAHVSKDELRRFLKCKRVGNFLLGKSIGEGSFARVKQGFHVLTGERVAVKIIDKKQAQKDKYVAKNMRREARILQMVCHPNVVQLLEVVETENRYYLVTELAAGGDLMDYICYRRKLGEVEVRKFIRQIVSAVHYLHRGGILHRDLKVENLLLDEDYNIKIIDFGLSNTIYGPTSEGQTMKDHCQTQCGSPAYAAPEILGHKPYGPQVDVWSIGVNMYAMLTGKLPYTAEPFHITTLYNKMKRGDMNELPEHLSQGCKDLIRRLLTFRPEERITLEEALNHEWLCKDQRLQSAPITFPNYLSEEVMEEDVVNHMVEKMHFKRLETIEAVVQNRPTPAFCVYHLLCKKLKKYLQKHPEMKITKPAKSSGNVPASRALHCGGRTKDRVTNPREGKTEQLNGNASDSHEKVVAERVYVNDEIQARETECLSNGVDVVGAGDATPSALEVKAFVVDQTPGTASPLEENRSKKSQRTTVTPFVEPEKDEQALVEDPVTPRTIDGSYCSICSNTSHDSARGDRAVNASGELVTITRNKASQNLSQISVESKSVNGSKAPLKNTSVSLCGERSESKELVCGEKTKDGDPDTVGAQDPAISVRGRSYSCTAATIPCMTPVEPVNAKVVSIPATLRRLSGSFDQMPQSTRMSLPHAKKHANTAASHYRQTSDCSVRSSTPKTPEEKVTPVRRRSTPVGEVSTPVGSSRVNRVSVASIPPYGLCCQLIRLSNSDVHSGAGTHEGQRSSDRRKTFSLERRLTARNDADFGSPTRFRRASTPVHSVGTQNGVDKSNTDGSALAQGAPFKMRLPLTRNSLDESQTFRRLLRRESDRSFDSSAEEPSRLSRTVGTGSTGNEPIISPRRSQRVSLPPAPGASPPITNDIAMETTWESSRGRVRREVAADPKDRCHVPDEDYVSRLSRLRRYRQLDRERRETAERGGKSEARRSSEPMSPLTSPRGAVIKLTHRPSRGRTQ